MGRSRGEGSCASYGPLGAGPRERARYGYRGVIVGEASHPGPVPAPVDHSGVASTGEVRRYMRPTAGGGIGPTRGGGHRQSRGGKPYGSGRRLGSAVGARADPLALDTPSADDDDGAEGTASRPRRTLSQDLDAGSPVAYAPLGGVAPPAVGVAADRPADRLGQVAGKSAVDEGLTRAQDEPLLAPRPADGVGDSQRRGGSDDETMLPADPRPPSSAPVDDVSMTGIGGVSPFLRAMGPPLTPPCPMGPVVRPSPAPACPVGLVVRPSLTPPCPMGPVVLTAFPLCRRPCVLPPRLAGVRAGRGRSRATGAPRRGARTAGSRPSSCTRAARRPAVIASRGSRGVRSGCPPRSARVATGRATVTSIALSSTRWALLSTSRSSPTNSLPASRRSGSPRRTLAPLCPSLRSPGLSGRLPCLVDHPHLGWHARATCAHAG